MALHINAILTRFVIVKENKKLMLLILDGWGYGKHDQSNAIDSAKTPFFNSLLSTYPNSKLSASGESVGLPEGQMGNSEVGHINLGAGRTVYQELGRINKAIIDGDLKNNDVLNEAFSYAKSNHKSVHFIGLLSDGGVHSHSKHLIGLCEAAKDKGLNDVFIHAFLDGRDTDPHSGIHYLENLENALKANPAKVATVIGRYYAMDRDKRWERVKLAYDAMVNGIGEQTRDVLQIIDNSYKNGITDEFLKPIVCLKESSLPVAKIENDDVVFCFNFRTDRGREITEVLNQKSFPEFGMSPLHLYYVTMTTYDKEYKNVHVVFDEKVLEQTMGEILEKNGKTQIRVAETEKYPHVTFFFSGGREDPFVGESRLLCPSPKEVPTYDFKPEMSAYDITEKILPEIENETADFICLNFANTDMVGHTGVFAAAVKAAEVVDQCIEKVATMAFKHDYAVFILADHGNSDFMINQDGSPNTQHSTNLVPLIVMDKDRTWTLKSGKLGDVAPSILKVMGIDIPEIMTGDILVE